MSDHTDIVLLQRDLQDLRDQAKRHREEIDELKALDQKRMRSAVIGLSALVLSMGGYIWALVVGDR